MGFKVVPHTADLAIEVSGRSMPELLESAMKGFRFLVAGDKAEVQTTTESFEIEAPDKESLLVRFINHLIFLFDTSGFLPLTLETEIGGLSMKAAVSGEIFEGIAKHCVKAATYHGLEVVEAGGLFAAQIIFDD